MSHRTRFGILIGLGASLLFGAATLVACAPPSADVDRPCLQAIDNDADRQRMQHYATTLPSVADIGERVESVCVLEVNGVNATMQYYQSDAQDAFPDYQLYAILTAHLRQMASFQRITGEPDAAQAYVLQYGRIVTNERIRAAFGENDDSWTRPGGHYPNQTVVGVYFGTISPAPVDRAFDDVPDEYYKATLPVGLGSGATTFKRVGNMATVF